MLSIVAFFNCKDIIYRLQNQKLIDFLIYFYYSLSRSMVLLGGMDEKD